MSLNKLWEEASSYRRGTPLNTSEYQSYIYRGIKIIKHSDGDVTIYTSHFGDFYREISKEDYEYFIKKGFRAGVYMLCLRNYNKTLEVIKTKIRNEVNGRNNQKHYNALRDHRVLVMNKYKDVINLKKETNECD